MSFRLALSFSLPRPPFPRSFVEIASDLACASPLTRSRIAAIRIILVTVITPVTSPTLVTVPTLVTAPILVSETREYAHHLLRDTIAEELSSSRPSTGTDGRGTAGTEAQNEK